jgi:mannitol/fructose-specific phosphotransferase system IIA component (Ntr-type)
MLISDYLIPDCIRVGVECDTKEDVLNELVELQFKTHPEVERTETMSSLHERESVLTTGIGDGIAIPHARIESCSDILVSLGILATGVDFNSLDDKPVRIVLLILFPKEKVNLQLRFLARVSRVMQSHSLLEELYRCTSSEQVIDTIRQYEDKHFHYPP